MTTEYGFSKSVNGAYYEIYQWEDICDVLKDNLKCIQSEAHGMQWTFLKEVITSKEEDYRPYEPYGIKVSRSA